MDGNGQKAAEKMVDAGGKNKKIAEMEGLTTYTAVQQMSESSELGKNGVEKRGVVSAESGCIAAAQQEVRGLFQLALKADLKKLGL